MAGDWIKMRDNLWDDPRVAKIVDLTDGSEAAVVGALYWLWATADQHTEDGTMLGLTLRAIDRKTGVKGFAEALCVVGWLADHPEGVRIVDFEKHNGQSAKKRCQTAKRVANHASANAPKKEPIPGTNADSVSSALAREREREERRREEEIARSVAIENDARDFLASKKTEICMAIKAAGVPSVNPSHPGFLALIDQGAEVGHFESAAKSAVEKGKGFAYLLAVVKGQIDEAAGLAKAPSRPNSPRPQAESFKERDTRIARERWEEMTGRTHPDLIQPAPQNFIDSPSKFLEIAA